MIAAIKARLRAWLIDLVREAIRLELNDKGNEQSPSAVRGRVVGEDEPLQFQVGKKKEGHPPIAIEPSFEQMQTEALKAQEEFYEPKRA